MMFLDFGINIAVAALLIITILYCWSLNKRIQVLQDGRGDLARLLKHFDESTMRASDSIASLQAASRKLGETVQNRIDKANLVADDLMFLVERAAKLSDQLEAGLAARKAADAALHTNLRPAAPAQPKPAAPRLPPTQADGKALLEALATRTTSDPALRGQRASPQTRPRVEQELLDLIKAR